MGFQEACTRLNNLIDSSQGQPILVAPDKYASFTLYKRYTLEEIQFFEAKWNIELPADYKQFLTQVGVIECFNNPDGFGSAITFLLLEDMEKYCIEYFTDLNNPFPQLVTIGTTVLEDVAVFDTTRESTNNFTIFFHDEDAQLLIEDWPLWKNFPDWLIRLVENNGKSVYGS